jgi:hypothetical protein
MSSSDCFGLTVIESCQAIALISSHNAHIDLWIADTGASCHMTCDDNGMFNCKDINENIKVGDGNFIKATKMGSKRVSVRQPDGVVKVFTINSCKYVPILWINLFSITSTLHQGWNLSNKGIIMSIHKHDESIIFDQVLQTMSGAITGVIMQPVQISSGNVGLDSIVYEEAIVQVDDVEAAVVQEEVVEPPEHPVVVPQVPDPPVPVIPIIHRDINVLHNLMGHVHCDAIKQSAKYYGIKLSSESKTCVSYTLAKIRQRISIKLQCLEVSSPVIASILT